jgi:hypothetical protein
VTQALEVAPIVVVKVPHSFNYRVFERQISGHIVNIARIQPPRPPTPTEKAGISVAGNPENPLRRSTPRGPLGATMNKTYKKIDNLTKAKSLKDLAKRVQKILRTLAYHSEQSDSAVNDTREHWRETTARFLREECGM